MLDGHCAVLQMGLWLCRKKPVLIHPLVGLVQFMVRIEETFLLQCFLRSRLGSEDQQQHECC